MAQNRRRRVETARRYADATAKVDDAANRSDVAALTTFSCNDGDDNTAPDRNGALGSLAGELVYLGYSFLEVHGEYVGPGHAGPIAETTVLVTQPFPGPSTTFQRDMLNLARRHGVDVVQVWDRETHRTAVHGPDGPIDGDLLDGGPDFTAEGARAAAWSIYRTKHSGSMSGDRHSVLTDVSEGVGDVADGVPLLRYAIRRKKLFGETHSEQSSVGHSRRFP